MEMLTTVNDFDHNKTIIENHYHLQSHAIHYAYIQMRRASHGVQIGKGHIRRNKGTC